MPRKLLLDTDPEGKKIRDENDVGFFESALAGVATGLWNIPKGFVSLGAEVFDLIGNTDTAKEVDEWFDEVNPWDDEAEARTIGKITQAITQIAPLGIGGYAVGAKLGSKLARKMASRANVALKGPAGKARIQWQAKELADRALSAKKAGKIFSLNKFGSKVAKVGTGVVGGGVGEMVVADEDIGTLADMLQGTSLEGAALTMMDRETKEGREDAYRKLMNRVKFGTEGALFNLGIIGAGKGIKKLRSTGDKPMTQYRENTIARHLEKWLMGLRSAGRGTEQTLEALKMSESNIKAVQFAAMEANKRFDDTLKEIFPAIKSNYLTKSGSKMTKADNILAEKKFLEDIYEIIRPKSVDPKVVGPIRPDQARLLKQEGVDLAKKVADKKVTLLNKGGVFKINDYQITPKLRKLMDRVKNSGGDPEKIKNAILNMRMSVDNISMRFLQRGMPEKIADTISSQMGRYLTSEYKQFVQQGPFMKYKVTAKQMDDAIKLRAGDLKKYYASKGMPISEQGIQKQALKDVQEFIKLKDIEQAEAYKLVGEGENAGARTITDKLSKEEVESIKLNPSILETKVLEPWQEELAGIIKDPRYAFYSSVGKMANLNYTMKYMDDIAKIGSEGKNKFIFSADELSKAEKSNPLLFKEVKAGESINGLTPLEGKYIRAPMYDEIFDVTSNWLNRNPVGTAYKYMILAPKGISQVTKTILSPLTHVRNFISAGAFAAANGAFFPSFGDIQTLAPKFLGGEGLMRQAYDLTGKRVLGTMTKSDQELYRRLLKRGVVDTQVQVGEATRVMKDAFGDPQLASRNIYGGLTRGDPMKKLSKAYGKIQDAYVAEDDFWKIITWNLERNRYENILGSAGIKADNYLAKINEKSAMGQYLRDSVSREFNSYSEFLDEIAGKMVRNQVPNYAYVGKTARALRQSPYGNFIAFPIEIIRTGHNIFEQSIKEFSRGNAMVKAGIAGGEQIRNLGIRRALSFGMTVGGVPFGLSQIFKAKNDVTDEEMEALRKFVPEWSKNSTLLPTGRDEDGYLKYVDFSYSNAYDTLTRPFRAIMNEISQGDATEASLMKALGNGTTDAVMELMEPFASESIYTEALLDSTIRRGIGRGGRRVWSEEDDNFVKIAKGIGHIGASLQPGSYKQFKRIGRAVTGEPDEYGRTFDLEDEIHSLYGFREIKSDPERAMTFKITRFGSNLKKDENLFTSPLLKGGRVTPEDIINQYKYSESRRYHTLRKMYQDIEAARTLGMSEGKIRNKVKARKGLSKEVVNDVLRGVYTPKKPSSFFITRMAEINRDLNQTQGVDIPNPYYQALPTLIEIMNQNRKISLLNDTPKLLDIETQEYSKGGRVGMQQGGEAGDKELAASIWVKEPEEVKQSFEYDFDKYYASGIWMDKLQQEAPPVEETSKAQLPETPPVDPKLVSQMVNTNVMQTGLTPTETALLSNEEKVIRLKQRGMAQ